MELIRRLSIFLCVGSVGLLVDSATYRLLLLPTDSPAIARFNSLLVATAVTWILNRRFTFDRSGCEVGTEVLRYYLVAAVAQGVNFIVFLVLIAMFAGINHYVAILCSAVVATGFSFTGHSVVTFSPATSNPTPHPDSLDELQPLNERDSPGTRVAT